MTNRQDIGTYEPTRYEVVMERGDERYLVGYTARHSGKGINAYLSSNKNLVPLALDGEHDTTARRGAKGAIIFGTGWTLRFSGRTQREAAQVGELKEVPYRHLAA